MTFKHGALINLGALLFNGVEAAYNFRTGNLPGTYSSLFVAVENLAVLGAPIIFGLPLSLAFSGDVGPIGDSFDLDHCSKGRTVLSSIGAAGRGLYELACGPTSVSGVAQPFVHAGAAVAYVVD